MINNIMVLINGVNILADPGKELKQLNVYRKP